MAAFDAGRKGGLVLLTPGDDVRVLPAGKRGERIQLSCVSIVRHRIRTLLRKAMPAPP